MFSGWWVPPAETGRRWWASRLAVLPQAWQRWSRSMMALALRQWMTPGSWQACGGETEFVDGERIWVGVDLSGGAGRSDTAVVWVNERLHVGCEILTGDHDATEDVLAIVSELGRALLRSRS